MDDLYGSYMFDFSYFFVSDVESQLPLCTLMEQLFSFLITFSRYSTVPLFRIPFYSNTISCANLVEGLFP